MNVIDTTRLEKVQIIPGNDLINSFQNMINDLDSQQLHREMLLMRAETQAEQATGGGCVSEVSICENIDENDDYQRALQEISEWRRSCGAFSNESENLFLRGSVKIESYDDCGLSEASLWEMGSKGRSNEEEIDSFGYMAWIAR